MKIMIRSDIEGVTGVTTYRQVEGGKFGKQMLMNDLMACIDGIMSAGDHEIVVYDEHADGRNVAIDVLPECVSVIMGKPAYRSDWGGIDGSFDAMMMVGFHARFGVEGALLPHSYSRKNREIRLNGVVAGEIGMEVAIAGDFGVPLWLITGDSAGMAEAEKLVAGIKTVVVKEAMGEFEANCYSPRKTAKLIFNAAKAVVEKPPSIKPLIIDCPVEMQIDLAQSDYTTKLKDAYPEIFIKENTISIKGQTTTAVWSKYSLIQKEMKSK